MGPLKICLKPGRIFNGQFQLRDRDTGLPTDWPVGTAARLWITWGTGTEMIINGTVVGPWLYFQMTAAETELVPRGAIVRVELNYSGDPDEWRPWREGPVCT